MTLVSGWAAVGPLADEPDEVVRGMSKDSDREALLAAVRDAVHAPSIFNTQPWRWSLDSVGLRLAADPARRLGAVDPNGHLLLLSCGTALHHARVSLAAAG